jgi:PPM family protein phosphatase
MIGTPPSTRLARAIQLANQVIYQEAQSARMGATVAAVQCLPGRMSIAHVGDSRIYRLRNERLEQLTHDHSFIAEYLRDANLSSEQICQTALQNVLTRALGVYPEVEIDVAEEVLLEHDRILLCSDGLTGELSDAQIAGILNEAEEAQEAADSLVTYANQAGRSGQTSRLSCFDQWRKHRRVLSRIRGWGKMVQQPLIRMCIESFCADARGFR